MHALRCKLPEPRYLLTTALPAGEWTLGKINLQQLSPLIDYLNLMAYDFYGGWEAKTGHHARLFAPPGQGGASAHDGVDYVLSKTGFPAHKTLLGVPIYGRGFLGAKGPGQKYSKVACEDKDGGTIRYSELPRPGTTELVDQQSGSAYCVGGDCGFVSYDNPHTVTMKARYAREKQLGGLFYWEVSQDAEGERSLVYTGYMGLHTTG